MPNLLNINKRRIFIRYIYTVYLPLEKIMSPRPRRQDAREPGAMLAEIKASARQQMSEYGTAGLSLRGIARSLGITAPAIYNYFPRRTI